MSRWNPILVMALALALIVALCVIVPSASRNSPNSTKSTPTIDPPGPDRTTQAIGDGTYLNGFEYLRGVNVYTLQFEQSLNDADPTLGESQASYDYLASRGFKIVRLAVPWQRLQPIPAGGDAADGLNAPIDQMYLSIVQGEVSKAARAGLRTVLDLHNGCTYPWGPGPFVQGSLSCGSGISTAQATNIWLALSGKFKDDKRVAAYDLFNEPRATVGVDVYKQYTQAVVTAIRGQGDTHELWVEGILSSQGHLATIAPNGPWIVDPLNMTMYSEHFYSVDSSPPTRASAQDSDLFARLTAFADWCNRGKVRCSVGEVGWHSQTGDSRSAASIAQGWNDYFGSFYDLADKYGLDVTYFAASSISTIGSYIAYGSDGTTGVINSAFSQAKTIEAHPSRERSASQTSHQ